MRARNLGGYGSQGRNAMTGVLMAGLLWITPVMAQEAAESDAAREERETRLAEIRELRRELRTKARELAQMEREIVRGEARRSKFVEIQEWVESNEAGDEERHVIVERIALEDDDPDRPRLGMLVSNVNGGYRVAGVTPGVGAEAAGIKAGDQLLKVNGKSLSAGLSVADAMEGAAVGDTVPVVVERDGEQLAFDVQTSDSASTVEWVTSGQAIEGDIDIEIEGIDLEGSEQEFVVIKMGDDEGRKPHRMKHPGRPPKFRMPGLFALGGNSQLVSNNAGLTPYFGTDKGVLVINIDPKNTLGLSPGDVVLAVAGEAVNRPTDLGRMMLDREPGEAIDLEIMRHEQVLEIEGAVPAERLLGAPRAPRPPKPPMPPKSPKPPKHQTGDADAPAAPGPATIK
jgi:C-terminal processing protease CtpA/Prc